MSPQTPLLRQIHPSFLKGDQASTQAFRPTPKGKDRLSFDDGDQVSAQAAWSRYTNERGLQSVGILAVTVQECEGENLDVIRDGVPDPEHVSVNFAGKTNGQRKTISKHLRDFAMARGWQVGPEGSGE
jgi:hypothetical protein